MFEELEGMQEGTTSEVNENFEDYRYVLENEGINNTEGIIYGEGDLERIDKIADIMESVFTEEVIGNWENLSVDERTNYLNEYYRLVGEEIGINALGVYVDDLQAQYGLGTMGVNNGNGYLGIDITLIADDTALAELLDTTTHELRHQFQTEALANPEKFPDISPEVLNIWAYEFSNYIDPSYDFEGYQSQLIETDARAFAEEVVNEFITELSDECASTQYYDVDNSFASEASLEESMAANVKKSIAEDVSEVNDEAIEIDDNLNKNTFSWTAGQCAKASTGTQNYCLMSGSGR